ncbi:MAG: (2Fe-2S)-binding protein [Pseudomonadota bacterium]
MYLCLCNAIRDREFAASAKDAKSVAEVFQRRGCRPQCGKCLPDVADIIDEARSEAEGASGVAAE